MGDVQSMFRQMWEAAYPNYTDAEKAAAQARIDSENAKFVMVDWGEGPQRFYTGTINMRDVLIVHGPAVRPIWHDEPRSPIVHPIRGAA